MKSDIPFRSNLKKERSSLAMFFAHCSHANSLFMEKEKKDELCGMFIAQKKRLRYQTDDEKRKRKRKIYD